MRLLLLTLLALMFAAPAQAAPAKFALIVANSDYDGDGKVDASDGGVQRSQERGYAGDLANPWFDSVRVGEALKSAGFQVETLLNADSPMISGALARLRARAQAAGPDSATVFYYSGHGIQVGGHNYLIGARANLSNLKTDTSSDQNRAALSIGVALPMLLAGARRPNAPGYDLMLIDGCRDNPWEEKVRATLTAQGRDYVGERGFGAMSTPNARTVIGFSAQPGQYAQDGLSAAASPFANAIAQRAAQRGLPIDQLLQSASGQVAAATGAQQIPTVVGRFGDGTSLAP